VSPEPKVGCRDKIWEGGIHEKGGGGVQTMKRIHESKQKKTLRHRSDERDYDTG